MAIKTQAMAVDILPDPDPCSSSDESSSATDDEQQNTQQPQESEEESDDSDADSFESQNSPCASAFTVMPTLPKPISNSPQPRMPKQKLDDPVSKIQANNSKSPAETETEKIDKGKMSKLSDGVGQSVDKGKKVLSEGGKIEQKKKKSVFKWSEEAENALLGGMIDYKVDTGDDVSSTMDAFHNYVKKVSLLVTLTKTQLYEKIRRLKNKYQANVEKWQNAAEPVFSRPHEKDLFELSHKIWGSVTRVKASKINTQRESVANRELSVQEEVEDAIMEDNKEEETQDFWSLYPLLCASLESEAFGNLSLKFCDSKEYVKTMISGFGEEMARELEDEWKAIQVMGFQLYSKRVHLINKQAQAGVDSLCKNLSQ